MDWNLKSSSSWDLFEFEHEAMSQTDAFDIGDHRPGGNFSIDLKLGQVGSSSGDSMENLKQRGVPKMESSPSGPTKRPRANNNGTHAASCLVDGCNSDLSNCRDYHRRHKVCEPHSKTPQVTINGQKQRFCQQCSRFHSLDEFDEGKRSCRKRLDGHNRRRRKPQPDPFARAGSFASCYQGSQLFPFSSAHVYPSTTVGNTTWCGAINSEADPKHYILHQQIHLPEKQNLFHESSPSCHKGVMQFPFVHVENPAFHYLTPPETSVCQPLLRTISMSESNGGNHSMFCDRLTTQVQDSMDCALSLLSSSTQASENHMMQTDSMHLAQPPINSSLHDHNLLLSGGRSTSDQHCTGMFDMRSSDSSGNKGPETLPFSWQ